MVASRTSGTVAPAVVRWSRLLLLAFVVVLGILVLQPGQDHGGNFLLVKLTDLLVWFGAPRGLAFYTLEFLANIAMFVPFGALLPLALGSLRPRVLWATILGGLVLSGCIEFAQQFIPGRVSDPRDVVSNTLGAALGVLLVYLFRRSLLHSKRVSVTATS